MAPFCCAACQAPRSRAPVWTSDTGIDGENPVEIDELDLIAIDPLPSYVWFQDMADFADGISDDATGSTPGPVAAGARSVQTIQEPDL
jgi:hypothetical protein